MLIVTAVEPSSLKQLYRSVIAWPKTKGECATVAEKIRASLELPLVILMFPKEGIFINGLGGPNEASRTPLESIVESQFGNGNTVATDSFQIRQIQLSSPVSKNDESITHLAGAPFEQGWLIAGFSKPLSPKEEIGILGAARYLADLAVFSNYEQSIVLRDQFLSIASHELKTPLTSIYGILQLQDRIFRSGKAGAVIDKEQQQKFLKMVIRQVERLNELINGLLDVSRIQNGRFTIQPTEVDAANLVMETVNSRLNVIAEEAGVRVAVEAPEALPAWLDPVRFEEVITNLGMNAIRFSPEGGTVQFRVRKEGEFLSLSVHDQGPGLSEADRGRIFQPFERAQRSSRLGGLGLGLFISRQIAQMHGGNVSLVESASGKGNLFEAKFPLERGIAATA